MFTLHHTIHDKEIRAQISGLLEVGRAKKGWQQGSANASISPVQVSIEGLARHAVSLHVRPAGSSELRDDDWPKIFAAVNLFFNSAKYGSYSPSRRY